MTDMSRDQWQSYEASTRVRTWAMETAKATRLARLASTVLIVGAAVSVVVGIGAAVATYLAIGGGGFASDSWLRWAQAASIVVQSLVPAGIMLAAGAALRVQVARLDTDILAASDDDDDEPDSGADAGTVG